MQSGMDITEAFKAHFYYETYEQADKAIKQLNGKRLKASEELKLNHKGHQKVTASNELGSVADPVIQANGRLTFEDDLRLGSLLCFTTQ